MAELIRLIDVLEEHGLDLNSFMESVGTQDFRLMAGLPREYEPYRVEADYGEVGIFDCERPLHLEGYRYIQLSPDQLVELREKGEIEVCKSQTLWRYEAGQWRGVSADDFFSEEVRRSIRDRLDPELSLEQAETYRRIKRRVLPREFRFYTRTPRDAPEGKTLTLSPAMVWIDVAQKDAVETVLVAHIDALALSRVREVFPELFENDVHELERLTAERRPFLKELDALDAPQTPLRPSNIPPNSLLCLVAIALKYYDLAQPGERLASYREAMSADLRRQNYWVRGALFSAETKFDRALTLLTTKYASYSADKEVESAEDRRAESGPLVKAGMDEGLEPFRRSGAGLLVNIWLQYWKNAELAVEEDGEWVINLKRAENTRSDAAGDLGQWTAHYIGPAFAVELAKSMPWQFLIKSKG